MHFLRIPKVFLLVLAAIALLVAIPEEPLYVALCWIATFGFALAAVVAGAHRAWAAAAICVVMAVLWNPWWYIPMPQIAWSAINLASIGFLWWKADLLSSAPASQPSKRRGPTKTRKASSADKGTASIDTLQAQAQKGDKRAQYELAGRLQRGQGVAADPLLAREWYEKAAEQGYAKAQYRLGSLAEKANKRREARRWYQMAAHQHHEEAKAALLRMGPAFNDPASEPH